MTDHSIIYRSIVDNRDIARTARTAVHHDQRSEELHLISSRCNPSTSFVSL